MINEIPEEVDACQPLPLQIIAFNQNGQIPFGLEVGHIQAAMQEFLDFLGFVNLALHSKKIPRLESFLMSANFSSMVGEFMSVAIPKYCSTIVKNTYHNGHPDLIPAGKFPNDAVQHGTLGIEIKGSRHRSGWQGHNAEECWLMVFVFDANTSRDVLNNVPPRPFCFVSVYGAQLMKEDWNFSGRSKTSRRTITARVTRSGFNKMTSNWIYQRQGSDSSRGKDVDVLQVVE
ncbi:MAG: hypothetical protein HQL75_11035 [Magnetococcales bacterium]|nr:hypothetical protein [Magnetococcales bacterium]